MRPFLFAPAGAFFMGTTDTSVVGLPLVGRDQRVGVVLRAGAWAYPQPASLIEVADEEGDVVEAVAHATAPVKNTPCMPSMMSLMESRNTSQ